MDYNLQISNHRSGTLKVDSKASMIQNISKPCQSFPMPAFPSQAEIGTLACLDLSGVKKVYAEPPKNVSFCWSFERYSCAKGQPILWTYMVFYELLIFSIRIHQSANHGHLMHQLFLFVPPGVHSPLQNEMSANWVENPWFSFFSQKSSSIWFGKS